MVYLRASVNIIIIHLYIHKKPVTCTTNIHKNAANAAIKLKISEYPYIVQNLCTKVVLKSSYAYNILRDYFDTSTAL